MVVRIEIRTIDPKGNPTLMGITGVAVSTTTDRPVWFTGTHPPGHEHHAIADVQAWARSEGHRWIIVDDRGFVTCRAVVVAFRPPTHPLAYDLSDAIGGRFVVRPEDHAKVALYQSVTVRFHPQVQFAALVEPALPALPWEQV